MKKSLLTLLFILVCSLSIFAQSEIISKVDEMIKEYADMNMFSGTVMIAEKGESIYHKAFGYSDIENDIKNMIDTKFNFGSIGKMFTGVTILKLAEEGKLNLDDNIAIYIDYFPEETARKITIRQLLQHKAGLGDYLGNPQFRQNIDNFKSLDDLMNIIINEPLLFEPGTSQRYSNSGYATLGAIIASVTGKSFYEAVEEMILKPLSLDETYYVDYDLVRNDVTKYMRNFEGNIVRTPFRDWPSPAGGEYSTVSDLVKFIQGIFYSNKILTDKSKALFLNQFNSESGREFDEIIRDENFIPMWAGGAPGVNGIICQFINNNISIAVLSNFSPPAAIDIGRQIRKIIETGNYDSPQIPLEEKLYKVYLNNGADYIKDNFEDLIHGYSFPGPRDGILNQLGYNLLGQRKIDEAISIFKVNTKLFSEVANTFDSLAEAYLLSGNKASAVENYRKVLELDPNNANAAQKVKELESDKN